MISIKKIGGVLIGLILLNNSLYPIISLPTTITLIAIIGAAALLLMDSLKGGILGKACLIFGIIIGIYALAGLSGFIGISIPFISFIYGLQNLAFIVGGILLIITPFINI